MRLSQHARPLSTRVVFFIFLVYCGLHGVRRVVRGQPLHASMRAQVAASSVDPPNMKSTNIHASLPSGAILKARRNHGCAFLKDVMVLAGGRHAHSIEVWNTVTGQQELAVTDEPLLDINHFQLLVLDKIGQKRRSATRGNVKRTDAPKEIWIPCGFVGSDVDGETNSNNTLIIDPDENFRVKLGPKIDQPRGGCGALALDIDGPGTPEHICVFGGSVGPHNGGTFTKTVSCYDRVQRKWHTPLPQLPVPADHLNVVRIPAGVDCDGVPPSPERLLYFNFRDRAYGNQRPEIFALDIRRDGLGKVVVDGGRTGGWYVLGDSDKPVQVTRPDQVWMLTRDAAGVGVSPSGRFVFTFGGVHYGRMHHAHPLDRFRAFSEIRAIDTCSGELINMPTETAMMKQRFAVVTCQNANQRAITCGGTSTGRENLESCDVHDLHALEQMALAASLGVKAGDASF
jgi:hypothetical protein